MEIRPTRAEDWQRLRQIRLAALQDAPTAFGVSYSAAAADSDERWQARAAPGGSAFWLAFDGDRAVGMVGAVVDDGDRLNLIGMWVEPAARGGAAASGLVEAVKARALERGYERMFLDVAPENGRASGFYLKQGFSFLDEWEPLQSHPHILVRKMVWECGGRG